MKALICIDHSTASASVLDAVSEITWPTESQFKVIHVLESLKDFGTPANLSSPQWHRSLDSAQEQLNNSAARLLQDFVSQLHQKFPDGKFETLIADTKGHSIDSVILTVAGDWQPDLILIGSHGKQGLSRLLLGSVSYSVLCHAKTSVRIIKRAVLPAADSSSNVLIPLDYTPHSETALEVVRSRPWSPNTHFRLFSVLPQPLSDGAIPVSGISALYALDQEDVKRTEAAARLADRANDLSIELDGKYKVDSLVVRGDPRESIIEQAYTWPAGLILIGAKGKTALTRFFLGSISSAVALSCPCSIEVVRSH